MLQLEFKLVRSARCGVVLAIALLAGPVHAKPKAAKHAASAAPAQNTSTASPSPAATTEPSPAEPPSAPASVNHEDKPRLQVTAVASSASAPQPSAATATATATAANEKLAALRADVSALTDDLVEARSRAALLGKTLFKTQVRVRVQNLAAPDPVLVKLVLKLDGAPIFRGDAAALSGDDARQVFQSFIAPGAHVLSAEIEQRSQHDAAYGYVLHDSYRFQALRDKRSELTLVLDDDSDLADEFPDDAEGEYEVRVKLRVKTKALNEP
jgi:hypothetical protein